MQSPEKFRIFYNQTIHPELVRLDRMRRQLLRKIILSMLLMTVIIALLYMIGIFVLVLYVAIPFVIYAGYMANEVRKFALQFKPRVVKLILDFIDDGPLFGDLSYKAKGFVDRDKFLHSAIFGVDPVVYEGEDLIEGRIGDVEFEMSELKVEEYSQVRNRLNTVFRGIFLRAKFFYPPKGSLLVIPRTELPDLSNAVKDFISKGGQLMDGFIRHRQFREIYTIYGTKNTKVHELLPVELMDFILEYRSQAGEVYLSLFGKNCYVAVTNEKDILEPKLFQSNVSFDLVREFYDDIYAALFIVTALDTSH